MPSSKRLEPNGLDPIRVERGEYFRCNWIDGSRRSAFEVLEEGSERVSNMLSTRLPNAVRCS